MKQVQHHTVDACTAIAAANVFNAYVMHPPPEAVMVEGAVTVLAKPAVLPIRQLVVQQKDDMQVMYLQVKAYAGREPF